MLGKGLLVAMGSFVKYSAHSGGRGGRGGPQGGYIEKGRYWVLD